MTVDINISALKLDWESGICLRPLASKYGISPATAKNYLNDAGVDTSKKQCFTKEVWQLIQNINAVLSEYETRLTVRQLFYQLATRHIVPLTKKGYRSVQSACSKGRKKGYVDWEKIEDRTRKPHTKLMWQGLDDFKNTILIAYQRNIWINQQSYFEVWLEKNALYGVISPITQKYGITLQVITGYSSDSAIYEGANRFKQHFHSRGGFGLSQPTILYLGDHDATGIDIDRDIRDSFLNDHDLKINVKRIGLLYADIGKYNLLPNFEKETDTRLKGYRAKGYTKQAELDALPPDVLIGRVESAITSHLDMGAFNECKRIEAEDLNKMNTWFDAVQSR